MADDKVLEIFHRQRRNLIAISLFIVLYRALGLKVQQISILGNNASVEAGSLFSAVLLIVLLYFSWRYTHYLDSVQGLEKSKYQFKTILLGYLKIPAAKTLSSIPNNRGQKQLNVIVFKCEKLEKAKSLKGFFQSRKTSVDYQYNVQGHSSHFQARAEIKIPIGISLWTYIKTTFNFLSMQQHFSDYIFPYLFAILAVCEIFHISFILPLADILVPGYERPNR